MNFKSTLLAVIVVAGFIGNTLAEDVTHSTPAVQGYDVISYHTSKRPIRGNGHFTATHDGARYQFASEDNMEKFKANPEKYVPAYNGYCAYGVAIGKKYIGDPEVWRVVDGIVYLNLDVEIQDLWFKDVSGKIKTADVKWEQLKDKDPSSL